MVGFMSFLASHYGRAFFVKFSGSSPCPISKDLPIVIALRNCVSHFSHVRYDGLEPLISYFDSRGMGGRYSICSHALKVIRVDDTTTKIQRRNPYAHCFAPPRRRQRRPGAPKSPFTLTLPTEPISHPDSEHRDPPPWRMHRVRFCGKNKPSVEIIRMCDSAAQS